MKRLTFAALEARADHYDQAVLATPDVDAFCTSSAWVLSAHESFHSEQEPFVWASDAGYLCLARGVATGLGRYLAPLDAVWGLASPLVGPDPASLAEAACEALETTPKSWDALWLCGLVPGSRAYAALAVNLGHRYTLYRGPSTRRHVASIEGGLDGFLSRRSAKLRANIRRARRRAADAGITLSWIDQAPGEAARAALYRRVLDVDRRSWKGRSDQGLAVGGMAEFYDRMTRRLVAAGRLRIVFATRDAQDLAMGFGAVFGDTFRGLQMSFDDRFRGLSLGNIVQAELIDHLACEGVSRYDLGTEMDYKRRWASPGSETVTLVVRP